MPLNKMSFCLYYLTTYVPSGIRVGTGDFHLQRKSVDGIELSRTKIINVIPV